VDSYLNIITAW